MYKVKSISVKTYDLVCLELGLEPFRFVIMRRRLLYLQHILKQNDSSLVKNFLMTQMLDLKKKDWGNTVLEDFKDLDINLTFEEIEKMGKQKYKEIIKAKVKEKSLEYLVNKKTRRNGKGMRIEHTQLEMQAYLKTEDSDINNDERKLLFQLRTDMHFKI